MVIVKRNSLLRFTLLTGSLIALAGCSQSRRSPMLATFPIGTQVTTAPLVYTIVDANWEAELGTPDGPRLPKNRFMVVTLTVTNSGGGEAGVPLLSLVDSRGNTYMEEQKGDGVTQWLGFLRVMKPAETDQGQILFDVPPGAYKLRLSSGGDPEQEKAALVDIPFMAEKDPSVATPQPAAPPGPATPAPTKLK